MVSQDLSVPEPSAGDVAHTSITTLLGLIPFAAGAGELFKLIVSPPVERRREEWMRNVVEAIRELQLRHTIDIDSLQQDEEFITLLIRASQIAVQTHLTEKHLMLKHALINSVLTTADFDTESVYLGLIEQLTPTHLHILQFIDEHEEALVHLSSFEDLYSVLLNNNEGPVSILHGFELSQFRVYIKDLEQAGLVLISDEFLSISDKINHFIYMATEDSGESGLPHACLTEFGKQFMLFIKGSVAQS